MMLWDEAHEAYETALKLAQTVNDLESQVSAWLALAYF